MVNPTINTIERATIPRSPETGSSGYAEISPREGVTAGIAAVQPNPSPVVEEVVPVVEVKKTVPSFRIGYPGIETVNNPSNQRPAILILLDKLANKPIPSGV